MPAYNEQNIIISSIVSSMKEWDDNVKNGPPMMVCLLKHRDYFSFQSLKNPDLAIADVLFKAREEVDFDLYIGVVRGDLSARNEHLVAQNLKSYDSRTIIVRTNLIRECVVTQQFFSSDGVNSRNKKSGEDAGNGCHWAALLFWPYKNRKRNVDSADVVVVLNNDVQSVPVRESELEVVATDLIRECASPHSKLPPDSYLSLLQSLRMLGRVDLISDFLGLIASSLFEVLMKDYSSFADEILTLGLQYGWELLRLPLLSIFDKMSHYSMENYSHFLSKITQRPLSEVQKDVCQGLAIVAMGVFSSEPDYNSYCNSESCILLLQSLQNLGDEELISKFLADIALSSFVLNELIVNRSFTNEILALGKNYGWSILKQPLSTIFNNISSNRFVREYGLFLIEISLQPISDIQAEVCCTLADIAIESLTSKRAIKINESPESCVPLLQSLQNLGKLHLISKFFNALSSLPLSDTFIASASFSSEIFTVSKRYGWNILRQPLQAIFDKLSPVDVAIENHVQFLYKACQQPASGIQRRVCRGLAASVVRALSNQQDTVHDDTSTKFLLTFIKCLMTVRSDQQLTTALIQVLKSKPKRYPIMETLVPVCTDLESKKFGENGSEVFKSLLSYCVSSLETSSSRPLHFPTNRSQQVRFSCTCKDCQTLMTFLRHPVEVQCRFKMDKGRRDHLQRQMLDKKCLVSISTIIIIVLPSLTLWW